MSPHLRHFLERLQVQAAAVAAACVAYFLGWRLISPWDPQAALAFVPAGEWTRLAAFAGTVWGLSAGCAVLTISTRPEGALLAVLVGTAGLCWQRGPMRTLLWGWEANPKKLFSLLGVEVLAMGGVLIGAVIVIAVVRWLARQICPRWVWKEAAAGQDGLASGPTTPHWTFRFWLANVLHSLRGRSSFFHSVGCLAMELAVAVILLVLTFRSTEHGQIAFALAGSFFVSALVADHVFPHRSSVPFWLGPLMLAALVFALAPGATGSPGPVWRKVLDVAGKLPLRAALPVDWLSLGCGGAVAGFWLSRRLHHADQVERQAKEQAQTQKA